MRTVLRIEHDLGSLGSRLFARTGIYRYKWRLGLEPHDFSMGLSAPVNAIRCITGPTLPKPSLTEGRFFWRLVSHLSLNYLTLVDSAKGDEGAAGLRDLLKLYIEENDVLASRQIEGLLTVKSRSVVRRVSAPGPISFARGLEVTLTFDEAAFAGTGVFVIGAVLEQFFQNMFR